MGTLHYFCRMSVMCILLINIGVTQSSPATTIFTNQNYLETIQKREPLNIHSVDEVFEYVFTHLPSEVTVYPTENYYYYSFYNNGIELSGNIRLDALDRDQGIVHFACFSTFNRWNEELINHYKPFSSEDEVHVKKMGPLQYNVTYKNKTVLFNLNDLSNITPPISKIRDEETFIGPVYDESGIQFYLLYNPKIKRFHYVLNDSFGVPDTLSPSKTDKDILIGTRTGFSFYRDHYKDRLILIGVYAGNSMVNNYFDGPFDQLPDNFIRGDQLKEAFIDQRPELAGKIDRFGNTDHGASRVLITPYIHYLHESQLAIYKQCINEATSLNDYYACFDQEEPNNEDYNESN